MEIRAELEVSGRQQLVLSRQMQQSLAILQAPVAELSAQMREVLAEHPFLDSDPAPAEGALVDGQTAAEGPREASEEASPGDGDVPVEPWGQERRGYGERPRKASASWRWDLLQQYRLQTEVADGAGIAEYLIGCLDGRGYLAVSVAKIARELSVARRSVEDVRQVILRLCPVGVGARDVTECLLVQLEERGEADPLTRRLLKKGLLPLLAQRNFELMARKLGATVEDVQRSAERIARMTPRPLRGVPATQAHSILPDLTVVEAGDSWEVMANEEHLPAVRLVPPPPALLHSRQNATRAFVHRHMSSARWFLGSLAARRRTLVGLMRLIVEEQAAFFREGSSGLKPLVYRHVAGRLGLHESTIARAVRGKYVQTPRGLFPLRFFFSKGLPAVAGMDRSPAYIRQRIVELIGDEPPRAPLTDQDLTTALLAEGILISRRTVAKYRDQLRIPKASFRRGA